MLKNLVDGLTELLNGPGLAYLFGGSIAGMLLGVVPGVSGIILLSVLLSFLYHISLTGAICLFIASYSASFFSASITSILLNTPAHPEAFAVTFDGFPMAQRGEAGRALGLSASATCVGGIIGCACLVGLIQIINDLPGIFHPPEYVALITIALVLVGTLGTDSASKGLISGGIGILLACVGVDPVSGYSRFTFGTIGLLSGISLVALALGLFAVPQMLIIFGTANTIAREDMLGNDVSDVAPVDLGKGFGKQVVQGVQESLHHWVVLIRSSLIGVLAGVIPGIGGFAANFLSYGIAQQLSKRREMFGTGVPEGIIAPEASSLSKEAGSMIPIIGLGIPGGIGGALFLAALTIKGVKVGYGLTTNYPTLPYEIMWVVCLGGIIGTVTGLLAAPFLAKVTRVPGPLIVPVILAMAVVGPFIAEATFFNVVEVLCFACFGILLRRLRYSLASFVIGLVLGPILESNISITRTDYPGLTFLERPLTDVLFVIGVAAMVLKTIQMSHDAKKTFPQLDQSRDSKLEYQHLRQQKMHPYPFFESLVTLLILSFTVFMVVYAIVNYDFQTCLLPAVSGSIAAACALWRLPFVLRAYIIFRQYRATSQSDVHGRFADSENEQELITMQPLPAGSSLALGQSDSSNLTAESVLTDFSPRKSDVESTSVSSSSRALAPIEEKSWGRNGQYTRELIGLLWFVGCITACYVFGYYVGIPAFMVLYGLTATRRVYPSLLKRARFALISAAIMWAATFEMINILHLTFSPVIKVY